MDRERARIDLVGFDSTYEGLKRDFRARLDQLADEVSTVPMRA